MGELLEFSRKVAQLCLGGEALTAEVLAAFALEASERGLVPSRFTARQTPMQWRPNWIDVTDQDVTTTRQTWNVGGTHVRILAEDPVDGEP